MKKPGKMRKRAAGKAPENLFTIHVDEPIMQKKKLRMKKALLWTGAFLLLFAIVLASAVFYLSRQWRPLLGEHMKQLVTESTDSLYRVEYQAFDVNIVTGNAWVRGFKLIPDTNVYKKMALEARAPDNLYELSVNEVMLKNFHPGELYRYNSLNIDNILIKNPRLQITNKRQPYNETDTAALKKGSRTLYSIVSKVFKKVKVNHIGLQDIDFTFVNRSNQPAKQNSVRNLNVNITDVLIDSLSEKDPRRLYTTRNVEVLMAGYRIATADSLYYLNFKNIAFSTLGRKLTIDTIRLTPRYSISDFYRKVQQRKDRFNIVFRKVAMSGMDLHRFSRDQKLYVSSFSFHDALVEVYNTNAWPKIKSGSKRGKDPHQQLQKVAPDLKIDTLNVRNTLISYSEYNTISRQTGKLTFNRTSGRLLNVTNDSAALASNHYMKAYLTSFLMNSGKLDIIFDFNLTDPHGAFTYEGTLGSMDGRQLNRILRPLGMVEVNTAHIDKLKFNAKASERGAFGEMTFYYRDLNVKVLGRDKETGKVKKQGFLSGIANVFILHKDNPDSKGRLTRAKINYARLPADSFFGVLWKGLFSGIKESVGVNAKKEENLRNTATKVNKLLGGIRQKLEERKERREERKEEREKKKELKEQTGKSADEKNPL
jgi:hypothetical protein